MTQLLIRSVNQLGFSFREPVTTAIRRDCSRSDPAGAKAGFKSGVNEAQPTAPKRVAKAAHPHASGLNIHYLYLTLLLRPRDLAVTVLTPSLCKNCKIEVYRPKTGV